MIDWFRLTLIREAIEKQIAILTQAWWATQLWWLARWGRGRCAWRRQRKRVAHHKIAVSASLPVYTLQLKILRCIFYGEKDTHFVSLHIKVEGVGMEFCVFNLNVHAQIACSGLFCLQQTPACLTTSFIECVYHESLNQQNDIVWLWLMRTTPAVSCMLWQT